MPFYPLPLSWRNSQIYQNLPNLIKFPLLPIFCLSAGICFVLDSVSLPFRWIYHEIVNHYSDMDDSEWK